MIYRDGKRGTSYIKRFSVTGVTREKTYNLTRGKDGSKVLYFTSNPNGEAEIITIILRQSGSIKKLKWDIDFADLEIKGRASKGNIVTKYSVKKIEFKEKGLSTLKPRKIWFDETVQRINVDNRGELLGEFKGDDFLLVVQQNGTLKITKPDLNMHFPDDMIILEKWERNKPLSAIYYNGVKQRYFVKRFKVSLSKVEQKFIPDKGKIQLELVSSDWKPVIEIVFSKKSKLKKLNDVLELEKLIGVKGIKAIGNQLSSHIIKNINILDPIPFEPIQEILSANLNTRSDLDVKKDVGDENKDMGQTELNFD